MGASPLAPPPAIAAADFMLRGAAFAGEMFVGTLDEGGASKLLVWERLDAPPRELACLPHLVDRIVPDPRVARLACLVVRRERAQGPLGGGYHYSSQDVAEVWTVELTSGEARLLLPSSEVGRVSPSSQLVWSETGERLAVGIVEAHEFRGGVGELDVSSGQVASIRPLGGPYDVVTPIAAETDGWLVAVKNETWFVPLDGGPPQRRSWRWRSPDRAYVLEATTEGVHITRGGGEPRVALFRNRDFAYPFTYEVPSVTWLHPHHVVVQGKRRSWVLDLEARDASPVFDGEVSFVAASSRASLLVGLDERWRYVALRIEQDPEALPPRIARIVGAVREGARVEVVELHGRPAARITGQGNTSTSFLTDTERAALEAALEALS